MDAIKQYYMNVYSVAYSSDGNYLAAGNEYGSIAIFHLAAILEANTETYFDEKLKHPIFKFKAHNVAVYSLISSKKLILSGSLNEICAWSWSNVKKNEKDRLWCLNLTPNDGVSEIVVNSLAMRPTDDAAFYAGCSDSKVYCIDIKMGTIMFSLSGHVNYIHCIAAIGAQECVSASEDGCVKIWDARKDGSEVHTIEPYTYKELSQPQFGKWIGCVAVSESAKWMVCGGGPALGVWHLGYMVPAMKLQKNGMATTTHAVRFFEDEILSGGKETGLDVWTLSGKLTAEIPTSSSCIFCINISASNTSNEKVLSACGTSCKIDVCRNFKYLELKKRKNVPKSEIILATLCKELVMSVASQRKSDSKFVSPSPRSHYRHFFKYKPLQQP